MVHKASLEDQHWYWSRGWMKGSTSSFCWKSFGQVVQTMSSVKCEAATKLQANMCRWKSFCLRGEHDELVDSHFRVHKEIVVCNCELQVHHRWEKWYQRPWFGSTEERDPSVEQANDMGGSQLRGEIVGYCSVDQAKDLWWLTLAREYYLISSVSS